MKEKIGEILGVFFETKIRYYCLLIFLNCGLILLQCIGYHYYGLQLEVIQSSVYQLYSFSCDVFTILLLYVIVKIIELKKIFDKK